MKKSNTEVFKKRVTMIHNGLYGYDKTIYVKSTEPVIITCPIHGDFEQTPKVHLNGAGCKECGYEAMKNAQRCTQGEFEEKANVKHNSFFDYSDSIYVNNKTKIDIKCPIHGIFSQKPDAHLNGDGCPKCAGVAKKTNEDFFEDAINVHGYEYDYSDVIYANMKTCVKIRCKIHGIFEQTPLAHIHGKSGCPKCAHSFKSDKEAFSKQANIVHDFKFNYSKVVYINSKTNVEIICKEHGSFFSTPNNHLRGTGCPKCSTSKGEILIENILKKFDLKYIEQKTFDGCTFKNKLRFDFYLPEYNMCIEYNGIQHYEPVKRFGGDERFEINLVKDNIKDEYCKSNNIKLLKIKYNDSNIEEKIINFLNE